MEIEIKNLCKNFGRKKALDNVNLNIKQGMFGLLGKNGAGKSTLMKILATILNKSSGQVNVCNIDISNKKEIRNIVGYLPQEFSFCPKLSVYETLDYIGVLNEMSSKERKRVIPDLLEKVALLQYKSVKVKALSGGMKRRLGIAQAIMNDPKIIIVDEPTAGLDPEERIRFRNLLCDISKDKIVILSTHIVEDIETTCEKTAILNEGKIIYNGSINELKKAAENHVYIITIDRNELGRIEETYKVISMNTNDSFIKVRVLCDEKPDEKNVEFAEPNIEDAYMFLLGGKYYEKSHI